MGAELPAALAGRREALRRVLAGDGGLLVAFSGGVDSSTLLACALADHAGRVVAATVSSALLAPGEVEEAAATAAGLGAEHVVVEADPLARAAVVSNPPDRCYHCKLEVFRALVAVAGREGLAEVVDGSNVDDAADYRPGRRALAELGVRSPLRDAGLGKAEIRAIARHAGLACWDAPAAACLASRVPYGERLTPERLARIGRAEAALRAIGWRHLRVRDHGALARVEVPPSDVEEAARPERRVAIVAALRPLGYAWVALDLEGYRTGAMNEPLEAAGREGRTVS